MTVKRRRKEKKKKLGNNLNFGAAGNPATVNGSDFLLGKDSTKSVRGTFLKKK